MGIIDRFLPFIRQRETKMNPAYEGMIGYSNMPKPIRMDDNYRALAKEGYQNDTVYKCVSYIARNGGTIPPKLYKDASMQDEITEHPLLDLLNHPNNEKSGVKYREEVLSYKLLSGNSFQYAIRLNRAGPPAELWPLRPDLVEIQIQQKVGIIGYKYDYLEEAILPENIGHTKYWNPLDENKGLSPLVIGGLMIDQQKAAKTWNLSLLQNSARPPGAWVVPTPLSENDRRRLQESLKQKLQGYKNAGAPPVLDAGLTWQSMSVAPGELDWLEGIKYNAAQIANIYSLAPQIIGDTSASTYDNFEQALMSSYTEAIFPELDDLYGLWNVWLLPMYPDLANSGAVLYYDKESIEVIQKQIQATKDSQADRAQKMWSAGIAMLNEARELSGLEPVDGGDVFFVPSMAKIIPVDGLQAYAEQSAAPPPPPPVLMPPGAPGDNQQEEPGKKPEEQELPEEQAKALLSLLRQDKEREDLYPALVEGSKALLAHSVPETGKEGYEAKALDLETAEQKKAYIEDLEATRRHWEEEAETRLQQYFAKERQAVVSSINPSAIRAMPVKWDKIVSSALETQEANLKTVMTKIYTDVAGDVGDDTLRSLKGQVPRLHRKDTTMQEYLDIFGPDILAFLFALAGQRVKGIMDTTRTQLQTALARGVVQGESIPNLAKRIDDLYLQQIIPNRSTVIARTEVVAASNYGSYAAAKQSGLTLRKVWLATGDNRTRPDHLEADGQEVDMDEAFDVGGYSLMFPGDSSMGAPASEVVQCRCTQYYKRVRADESGEDEEEGEDKSRSGRDQYRRFVRALEITGTD